MNEKLAQKLFYVDKLRSKFNTIAHEKSDLLLTQNMLVDEEYYSDEIEAILEDIDIALENVKENIEELIEILTIV